MRNETFCVKMRTLKFLSPQHFYIYWLRFYAQANFKKNKLEFWLFLLFEQTFKFLRYFMLCFFIYKSWFLKTSCWTFAVSSKTSITFSICSLESSSSPASLTAPSSLWKFYGLVFVKRSAYLYEAYQNKKILVWTHDFFEKLRFCKKVFWLSYVEKYLLKLTVNSALAQILQNLHF